MNETYYENDALWGRKELTILQQHVVKTLTKLCNKLQGGGRIADLGCGDGIVLQKLSSLFPNIDGYGIDFSEEALKYLPHNIHGYNCDLKSIPFEDNYFDICFCIDVLEHIPPKNMDIVISEIFRVCKGTVLFVSPYNEADVIKTICPHCGCIFNPYYHLNRFSVNSWEKLLQKYSDSKSWSFVPMGSIKSSIPLGIGTTFAALNNYVAHNHQTLCPQCGSSFNRSISDYNKDTSIVLASYAENNRELFGRVFEEIGVLIYPKNEFQISYNNINLSDKSNEVTFIWHKNHYYHDDKQPYMVIKSVYEIDFNNDIYKGADLFASPGYMIDNGRLQKNEDNGSIIWDVSVLNKSDNKSILRLVFPPEKDGNDIRLKLLFSSNRKGTLKAFVYALPPKESLEVGSRQVQIENERECMQISLKQDDCFITPYGIFIDLIWETCDVNGKNYIVLYKIEDQDVISNNLYFNETDHMEIDIDKRKQLQLTVKKDYFDFFIFVYNKRIFDLTPYVEIDKEECIIQLPIFDLIRSENYIIKLQSEINQGDINAQCRNKPLNFLIDRLLKTYNICQEQSISIEQYNNEIRRLGSEIEQSNSEKEILKSKVDYLLSYIQALKNRNIVQRLLRLKE